MSTNLVSAAIFSHKSRLYPEIEPLFWRQATVEAHQHALLMFSFNWSTDKILFNILMLDSFGIQTRNLWNILRYFGNKYLDALKN